MINYEKQMLIIEIKNLRHGNRCVVSFNERKNLNKK